MEVGIFLVGEEQIGLPKTLEHFGVHRQRITLEVGREAEARVIPALAEENIHPVVLETAIKTR